MTTTDASTAVDLDRLQAEVGEHCKRFLTGNEPADHLADGLIVAEELAEVIEHLTIHLGGVCRAMLKRHHGGRPDEDWDSKLRDEVGDATIALLHLAHAEGWSLADALTDRWEEVRAR